MAKVVKVGFISLGCPKNQIDTEIMLKKLADSGYELTAEDIEADVIIINTCAFIESAKQEAIDNVGQLLVAGYHRCQLSLFLGANAFKQN